nr:hypothetical protein CFP56_49776 [Quercus suber]
MELLLAEPLITVVDVEEVAIGIEEMILSVGDEDECDRNQTTEDINCISCRTAAPAAILQLMLVLHLQQVQHLLQFCS